MSQFLGFGSGVDGIATLSGTDAPIDSSCSGIAAAISLSATNASFAAGQLILIHQTQGTGFGQWEINRIASYVAGTITTAVPLAFTYVSGAQVLVLPQYSSVTVSGTYTVKPWDGAVGGIMAFLCSGLTNITGTITANGAISGVDTGGYVGGAPGTAGNGGTQGESGTAVGSVSSLANGSGGGGGNGGGNTGINGTANAGGGGNGSAGNAGGNGNGGAGGGTSGSADLVTMTFGGAGGGGAFADSIASDFGGNGGGIIFICSNRFTVSGAMRANGGHIQNVGGGDPGGGAGGSILIKTVTATLGSALITAIGGTAPSEGNGFGGSGRIRVEACTLTGTTNPSANESVGGHNFCSISGGIFSE